MKKLFTLLLITLSFGAAQAQIVTYDITAAAMSPADCPGGCICLTTPAAQGYAGSTLNFTWTSIGTLTPTSITVEFYETYHDPEFAVGIPSDAYLNSSFESQYSSLNSSCVPVVGSVTLTPANYIAGGLNTFELDYYGLAGAIVEWDENLTWGSGILARVTVDYPLPPTPPVAVEDFVTVPGGSTGNVIDVQANDTDVNGDTLTTTIISGPTSGGTAIVLGGDSISYDPPASFCGEDTIIYQVCDPGPLCDTDTVFITVTDAVAPTAVCQNINVYLDSTGNASIVPADVDAGSTDNCSAVTLSVDISTFNCGDLAMGPTTDLIITGAYDGPLPFGLPKGIELYVVNNIADLSMYGISSANNGTGTTGGAEFTFPAVSATAGSYIYATSDSAGFADFFGFNADYVDGSMNINGDDAIELYQGSTVIDVFGDVNVDGTGELWEYLDGWAYSDNGRAASATFNVADWTYSGINALDGETTNGTAATPFPIGTYSAGGTGTTVTLMVEDALANTAACLATVTVMDTIAPWFTACPSNMTISADQSGCRAVANWTAPTEMDNCSGATVTSSHNPGDTLAVGVTTVTYTAMDASGNSSMCSFDITVATALATTATTTDVLCNGDSTGTAAPSGSGNVGPVTFDWGTMDPLGLPAGTHTYTVTDSIGCMITDSVVITEPLALSLSATPTDETNGSGNGAIDLTVAGGAGGNTFDWDNDGTGDFDDTEDLSSLSAGTYMVTVMDMNGCTDTLTVLVDNVVSVEEVENSLGLKVYPNPSDGQFYVEVVNGVNVTIEVTDILGKRIEFVTNASAKTPVNLTAERAGIYLVKITSGDVSVTKRLTIKR